MMSNLRWRVLGVALLAICIVAYEPAAETAWHRLWLPIGMAGAAWLMVQNLAAVCLGAALLAGIHSDPGSADWIPARAYPAVALIASIVLAAILARRFRAHIRATHAARWRHRRDGSTDDAGREDTAR
jgi:hypothetical protein